VGRGLGVAAGLAVGVGLTVPVGVGVDDWKVKVQWKPSKLRPLLEHVKAPTGISIVFCPGITGEALKWNSRVDPPPPPPLSAGIPLTVKTLGGGPGKPTKPVR
jgi:hypothetical protein